jgi:hypothetical protein
MGPAITPTVTKTIAEEIGDRSDAREKSPNPNINNAAKMKIGYSCIGGRLPALEKFVCRSEIAHFFLGCCWANLASSSAWIAAMAPAAAEWIVFWRVSSSVWAMPFWTSGGM